MSEAENKNPVRADQVERWWDEKRSRWAWRVYCGWCSWSSADLPFKDPDAAFHAVKLHGVLCKGGRT